MSTPPEAENIKKVSHTRLGGSKRFYLLVSAGTFAIAGVALYVITNDNARGGTATVNTTTATGTAAPVPTSTPSTSSIEPTVPAVVPAVLPNGAIRSNFDPAAYIVPAEVPPSSASEPSGNFRFICNFSHLSYDDPIVFPGQPGSSHLHVFFGNTATNADSTYESLRISGSGSCSGGPINRSAYWAPAVFNGSGNVLIPEYAVVYYKGTFGGASEIASIPDLPPGLRMIAGYNMEDPAAPSHFDWTCETGDISQQTIPDCNAGDLVGVRLSFPQCWNGTDLDSPDHRTHMAYLVYADSGASCPDGYPVHLPEYAIGIWYANDGNAHSWQLSSDVMPGMTHANGSTFHSDWFGAWDPEVEHTWLENCIHQLRDCVGGQLGDGTDLSPAFSWPDHPYAGPKSVPPPPRP